MDNEPVRKIIHVDMDAFYASVEQRDNPALRGRPVVVGGNPKSRGVVSTCSYEARKFGIHSAMASSKAARLCPHAVFVRPRFEAYTAVSRQVRDIFSRYSDLVEPLSLDEAYLDVTANRSGLSSATATAREILDAIRGETGLTASAGVSCNKFLAKVASDFRKPAGLTVVTPDQSAAFLADLPIRKFFGVGRVTEKRMKEMGVRTGKDLLRFSLQDLTVHFGKSGGYFYWIARGVDSRPVEPFRERKSVGREHTYGEDIADPEEMVKQLRRIADEVAFHLAEEETAGKTVTVKVRYADFTSVTRSSTLEHFIDRTGEIFPVAEALFGKTEAASGRAVRLLGITVSALDREETSVRQLEFSFTE